jgi:hypothetical protein
MHLEIDNTIFSQQLAEDHTIFKAVKIKCRNMIIHSTEYGIDKVLDELKSD